MYTSPQTAATLDGLNIFKAIGRALGSTGRALVSAIPGVGQAASAVLETAAHQPAKASATDNAAQIQQAAATGIPVTQTPGPASSTDQLLQLFLAKQLSADQTPAVPVMPTYAQPTSYQTPPSNEMPPWLIPVGLGGLALVLLMGRK